MHLSNWRIRLYSFVAMIFQESKDKNWKNIFFNYYIVFQYLLLSVIFHFRKLITCIFFINKFKELYYNFFFKHPFFLFHTDQKYIWTDLYQKQTCIHQIITFKIGLVINQLSFSKPYYFIFKASRLYIPVLTYSWDLLTCGPIFVVGQNM